MDGQALGLGKLQCVQEDLSRQIDLLFSEKEVIFTASHALLLHDSSATFLGRETMGQCVESSPEAHSVLPEGMK